MADYFHLLMAYIKIGVQLRMSCAPIALKIYFYFTSSNLTCTDNQRFTKVLVQVWNTISILDVVPQ